MIITQMYLPNVLPQWGIFAGVALITVGYVEKKNFWTLAGWIVLIITGLTAVYFNLSGDLDAGSAGKLPGSPAAALISTGWQTAAGGVLAIASLVMFRYQLKRYPLLAGLTIAYFILIFFLYSQVSAIAGKKTGAEQKTEQKP